MIAGYQVYDCPGTDKEEARSKKIYVTVRSVPTNNRRFHAPYMRPYALAAAHVPIRNRLHRPCPADSRSGNSSARNRTPRLSSTTLTDRRFSCYVPSCFSYSRLFSPQPWLAASSSMAITAGIFPPAKPRR